MTTTTETLILIRKIGQYEVMHCVLAADGYPYQVYDADDDLVEEFEIKAEAIKWARDAADSDREEAEEAAREAAEEAAEEARQERLDSARSDIESALAECEDEAVLVRIMAMLEIANAKTK